jgi:site-specific recombinase XerD
LGTHAVRHTLASHLVLKGKELMTLKELLCHKTIHMTLRYSQPANKHPDESSRKHYFMKK